MVLAMVLRWECDAITLMHNLPSRMKAISLHTALHLVVPASDCCHDGDGDGDGSKDSDGVEWCHTSNSSNVSCSFDNSSYFCSNCVYSEDVCEAVVTGAVSSSRS